MRRTKIICTLGPASKDEKMIEKMFKAGMNIARFNFSHGTHEYHLEMINTFRRVRDRLKMPAAVMLDTKGPEIRLRTFALGRAEIKTGDKFTLTTKNIVGNEREATVSYANLPSKLKSGDRILINDGLICLTVDRCTETDIICTVTEGGVLSDRKGVNIPKVRLDMPFMSPDDESDILFGIENDVDFISASFVRSKEDVMQLRRFLDYHGGHAIKIISKIENLEGIENFDEILRYSDGIMVARGDMGVEIEFERIPGLQKKFIRRCYQSGKMVITATQMLESMIHSPTPTRAEITDVANAVFDGTSAIMLSGETAVGDHPDLVVEVMSKIAVRAENDAFDMHAYSGIMYENDTRDLTNAMCDAACTTARDVSAKAIIAVTMTGCAARRVSKFRPYEPIIAATPSLKTYHQLSLSWGVFPVLALNQSVESELFRHAIECAKSTGLVSAGDIVVITAGYPLNIEGMTNTLRVTTVEETKS